MKIKYLGYDAFITTLPGRKYLSNITQTFDHIFIDFFNYIKLWCKLCQAIYMLLSSMLICKDIILQTTKSRRI